MYARNINILYTVEETRSHVTKDGRGIAVFKYSLELKNYETIHKML
jgi:hypothetical protein